MMNGPESLKKLEPSRSRRLLGGALLILALALPGTATFAKAGENECSSKTLEMELGSAGTYLVGEANIDEVGKFAGQCAYQFELGILGRTLGRCAIKGVTFEGSDPVPQLVNVKKSFEAVVLEDTVKKGKGPLSWLWSGDALNCSEAGCGDDQTMRIELVHSGFDIVDLKSCPWTKVQARFELGDG